MPTTLQRTRTSDDLVLEALASLGVLSAGQPVDPEDQAYVASKLDGIFRTLAALEIEKLLAVPVELVVARVDPEKSKALLGDRPNTRRPIRRRVHRGIAKRADILPNLGHGYQS
jgi:hypothetical protein